MMIRKTGAASTNDASSTARRRVRRAIKDLAEVCKLLSDETRLKVLLQLSRRGEMHVRALCDVLGQSQPAVSHHLSLLREAGLIVSRREGKHNFYRVLPERFERTLDHLFAAIPQPQQEIRVEDYVLSHQPQDSLVLPTAGSVRS